MTEIAAIATTHRVTHQRDTGDAVSGNVSLYFASLSTTIIVISYKIGILIYFRQHTSLKRSFIYS